MRVRWTSALAVVLLALSGVAPAQPDDPPAAAPTPLQQKEMAARGKAAEEMIALARFCATSSAYDDARTALAKAAALDPKSEAVKTELEKIKDKKGAPQKGA